jgi:hypothetical protein
MPGGAGAGGSSLFLAAARSNCRYDVVAGFLETVDLRQRSSLVADDIPDEQEIQSMQTYARYIAMVVRNTMEDFHCKHLSDEQMKELNPLIRNAIYTAIYGFMTAERSAKSKRYVEHMFRMIPPYWEEPVLLVDFGE